MCWLLEGKWHPILHGVDPFFGHPPACGSRSRHNPWLPMLHRVWQCLHTARLVTAGLNQRELLHGINQLATARFMHVIAPHPETGGQVHGGTSLGHVALLVSCVCS